MGYINWKEITALESSFFPEWGWKEILLKIPVRFTPDATGWRTDYITNLIENVLSLRICEKTGVAPELIKIHDQHNGSPLVKINGFIYIFCTITMKNKDDWYNLYGYFGGIK